MTTLNPATNAPEGETIHPEVYPETLPASWYSSDRLFEVEQQRIFQRTWFLFARESQFAAPGNYVVDDAWGHSVIVIRNPNGGLSGFRNICRHRAGRLLENGEGTCKPTRGLRCRYHGWQYDLTGKLKLAPGFSKCDEFDPQEYGLFDVRVDVWNGLVFVALSTEVDSLISWLGDIVDIAKDFPGPADLDFSKSVEIDGAINWKLYGENGVEGYHLPFVHTWLSRAVGASVGTENHENGNFVGFPVEYKEAWGLDCPIKGYWLLKFPGLLLHFSEAEFNCEQVIPIGVRHTLLRHWFWVPRNKPAIAGAIARDWKTTMQEDVSICQEVQRNIDGGVYTKGRLSPNREMGSIYFQELVRRAIGTASL